MSILGKVFRVVTYGESHGPAIGCVVEGCPSGLELSESDVQKELDLRKPGKSELVSPRSESDTVEIVAGVVKGKTTGTPICFIIRNLDADSSKYEEIKDTPRPGHADFSWREKFGWVDFRGGGRSSGRETAARVCAGAVAKKILSIYGIDVIAYSKKIGCVGIRTPEGTDARLLRELRENTMVKTLDLHAGELMAREILTAKKEQDSLGGIVEALAFNVPAGLGEPVFDKLDADLAKAVVSIPSVKGVEFGDGFNLSELRGSAANDEFIVHEGQVMLRTNRCGGILGGISVGTPIVLRVAIKPTPSIARSQNTVDLKRMQDAVISVKGRHDPCIVPRAVYAVEAMVAVVLADHLIFSGFIPRRL